MVTSFSKKSMESPPHKLHDSNSAVKVGTGEMEGDRDAVGLAVRSVDRQPPHRSSFCVAKQKSGSQNPALQTPATEAQVMLLASPVGENSAVSSNTVSGEIKVSPMGQMLQTGWTGSGQPQNLLMEVNKAHNSGSQYPSWHKFSNSLQDASAPSTCGGMLATVSGMDTRLFFKGAKAGKLPHTPHAAYSALYVGFGDVVGANVGATVGPSVETSVGPGEIVGAVGFADEVGDAVTSTKFKNKLGALMADCRL